MTDLLCNLLIPRKQNHVGHPRHAGRVRVQDMRARKTRKTHRTREAPRRAQRHVRHA